MCARCMAAVLVYANPIPPSLTQDNPDPTMPREIAPEIVDSLTDEGRRYLHAYQVAENTRSINTEFIAGVAPGVGTGMSNTNRTDLSYDTMGRPRSSGRSSASGPLTGDSMLHRLLNEREIDSGRATFSPPSRAVGARREVKGSGALRGKKKKRRPGAKRYSSIKAAGNSIVGRTGAGDKELRGDVIWRPALRVRLADDVPREIRDSLLDRKEVKEERAWGVPIALEEEESLSLKRKKKKKKKKKKLWETPLVGSTGHFAPKPIPRPPANQKIGSWYLPVRKWGKDYDEEELLEAKKKQEAESFELQKQRELAEKIKDLFIAKAYKAYCRKKLRKRDGIQRMPHFLAQVPDGDPAGAAPQPPLEDGNRP